MDTEGNGWRRRMRVVVRAAGCAIVLGVALGACSDNDNGDNDTDGSNYENWGRGGTPQGPGTVGSGQPGAIPSGLVGSWYAGAGHTTAPFDPGTGSWGRPSAKG